MKSWVGVIVKAESYNRIYMEPMEGEDEDSLKGLCLWTGSHYLHKLFLLVPGMIYI